MPFLGALNESKLGWLLNDESISVFNSWESSPHLAQITDMFERLWKNRSDSSMVISIPEALRRNLIEFARGGTSGIQWPRYIFAGRRR